MAALPLNPCLLLTYRARMLTNRWHLVILPPTDWCFCAIVVTAPMFLHTSFKLLRPAILLIRPDAHPLSAGDPFPLYIHDFFSIFFLPLFTFTLRLYNLLKRSFFFSFFEAMKQQKNQINKHVWGVRPKIASPRNFHNVFFFISWGDENFLRWLVGCWKAWIRCGI